MYTSKSLRRRGGLNSKAPTKPRHWIVALFSILVVLVCHLVLLPLVAVAFVAVMASLSHRTVIMLRNCLTYWNESLISNWADSKQMLADALFFQNPGDNLLLLWYHEILVQFGMSLWDLMMFFGLPFVAWIVVLLSIYRAPFMVYDLWHHHSKLPKSDVFASNMDLGILPLRHMFYLLLDLVFYIPFLLIPLILTVHRLPSLWSQLSNLSWDGWVEGQYGDVLVSEFKAIGYCADSPRNAYVIVRDPYEKEEAGGPADIFKHNNNNNQPQHSQPSTSLECDDEEEEITYLSPASSTGHSTDPSLNYGTLSTTSIQTKKPKKNILNPPQYRQPKTATYHPPSGPSWFCVLLFNLLFGAVLILLGIPVSLVILCTLSHSSIRLILELYYADWTDPYRLVLTVFENGLAVCLDLFGFIGLPIVCFWAICLTIYRLPITFKQIYDAVQNSHLRGSKNVSVSIIPMAQCFEILMDLIWLVFLFVPVLVTFHRLPYFWGRVRDLDYIDFFGTNGWRSAAYQEFIRIGQCGDDSTHTNSGKHVVVEVVVGVGYFIFMLAMAALAIPCMVATLLTLSHRAVAMIVCLLRTWPNGTVYDLFMVMIKSLLLVFFDLIGLVGLPFVGWFLLVVTIYRLPLLLKDIYNDPKQGPDPGLQTGIIAVLQSVWLICDLLMIIVFVPPILLTIHRVPCLIRRLKERGYEFVIGANELHEILWDEFTSIGYCEPSEEEKLIAGIIED